MKKDGEGKRKRKKIRIRTRTRKKSNQNSKSHPMVKELSSKFKDTMDLRHTFSDLIPERGKILVLSSFFSIVLVLKLD